MVVLLGLEHLTYRQMELLISSQKIFSIRIANFKLVSVCFIYFFIFLFFIYRYH